MGNQSSSFIRFRLKTLLAVTLISALLAGWWRERLRTEELRSANATLTEVNRLLTSDVARLNSKVQAIGEEAQRAWKRSAYWERRLRDSGADQ